MVKSKKTLAECGFLSGIGPARLHRMHKEERNPKAKDRLLAYAMRKEGMSVYAITTKYDLHIHYFHNYEKGGNVSVCHNYKI